MPAGTVENPRLNQSHGAYRVLSELTNEAYKRELSGKALQALGTVLDPSVVGVIEDIFAGNQGTVEVPQGAVSALLDADLLGVAIVAGEYREADMQAPGFRDILGRRELVGGEEGYRVRVDGRVAGYRVELPEVLPGDHRSLAHVELRTKMIVEGSDWRYDYEHWTLSWKPPF